MMFGHYLAWISAGIMGAGTAVILGKTIVELDPGDVAYYALGWYGFVIVIVAGRITKTLVNQLIFKGFLF